MGFLPYNTLVVLVGVSLLGLSAGVIGVFALLRGRALLGDATAHASLPGLCLAFMLVGERSMPAMLAGALVSGLAGVALLSLLKRWTRIKEDAALALVLSLFYALGAVLLSIIMTSWTGGGRSGLGSFLEGTTAGMAIADVYWVAGLAAATLAAVVIIFKEIKLIAFDADFAQAQGWPVFTLDYFLNLLVVLAVVIGLPAVGVLLTAALLIIPSAAARFWTDRLTIMILAAGFLGLIGTASGAMLSAQVERLSTGPTIILACTLLFLVSMLFGPRSGLAARWFAHRHFQQALGRHQLLCKLHDLGLEGRTHQVLMTTLGKTGSFVPGAINEGLLTRNGDALTLTGVGKELAENAARRQAMAERYLQTHPELAASLTTWFLTDKDPKELAPN